MYKATTLTGLIALFLLLMTSCSGGNAYDAVAPQPVGDNPPADEPIVREGGKALCIGLWQVTVDIDKGTIEAVDVRSSELIINVLGFLEPPALSGMTIDFGTLDINAANKTIEVDVILTHPIPDPVFTGFDVRGVVFGPEVANADGLTVIPSPQYFKGVPFGYKDGLLGVPDSTAKYDGLAGYKYFCDGLGKNDDLVAFMSNPTKLADRGHFSHGPQKNTRHYILDWNNVSYGFFVFNYAIYANYDWPVGAPPVDINDFDIHTANSAEAFCLSVSEISNSLWYSGGGGGAISLLVEAWDWQGDIADVTIESAGVIAKKSFDTLVGAGSTSKSYLYGFNNVPGNPKATGDLDILITVVDKRTFGQCWLMGLLSPTHAMYNKPVYNCWSYTTSVSSSYIQVTSPNGGEKWQPLSSHNITWLSSGISGTVFIEYSKDNFVADIHSIATGEPNDGSYTWPSIPYDPSKTVRVRISSTSNPGIRDISDGYFSITDAGWARTWGGTSTDVGNGVAVDSSGNSYVTGYFVGIVDFDPDPGASETHSSNDSLNIYLSKFDATGDFKWVRTWGGTEVISGEAVAVDSSGNAYVTGLFSGTIDFDPATGTTDNHTSNGNFDVFLSKFDPSGNFLWARTWGGPDYYDWGNAVVTDNSGNVYVAGHFENVVDFDPATGTSDIHTSNGTLDAFVSKFYSNGNFQWARTWGGSATDTGTGVAYDSSGNVYVTGYFEGLVDFDPATGSSDYHTGNGVYDIYLSKFNSSGGFQWARTWGGGSSDYCYGYDVATDASGKIYALGSFTGTVDFNPATGLVDNRTSKGGLDIYLSKFDTGGNLEYVRTWGGTSSDFGYAIAVNSLGNIYIAGCYADTVDFDPATGTVDNHTSNGGRDIFVSKFDLGGNFQWARTWGGTSSYDYGNGVATEYFGNVYVTGYFSNIVDFDPGPASDPHLSNGSYDIFLSKFLPDGNW